MFKCEIHPDESGVTVCSECYTTIKDQLKRAMDLLGRSDAWDDWTRKEFRRWDEERDNLISELSGSRAQEVKGG